MPKKSAGKLLKNSAKLRQRSDRLRDKSEAALKHGEAARKRARAARIKGDRARTSPSPVKGSAPAGTAHLQRLSSDNPEARDEGPRLIPFSGPDYNRRELGIPSLPTDGYVTLADKAMKMWERRKKPRGKP